MKNKQKKSLVDGLLKGVDVERIIKESLKKTTENILGEAYVSQPKEFSQVSEFISQKAKDSHEKLYKGYIEQSNLVSAKLDSVSRDTNKLNSLHSDYRSLKLDETYNLNAKWLHELFFANCFDPHSELYMESNAYMKLQRDFGSFEEWQRDFMACALSCGNGWAICAYNLHLQRYVNTFISNNSQDVMVGLYPIVVMDMFEHAYTRDYMNDRKSYLVAMMREINWDVIEERVKKAEYIAGGLK